MAAWPTTDSKPAWQRLVARAADRFNAGFERMSDGYAA
jgi:hypothetical protein